MAAVSRNDIILGLVALVLVVFSLFVSLVVPRRNPDFPGRGLRLFVAMSVLLVFGMLTAVEVFGEGHDIGGEGIEEADTGPGDTGMTATTGTGTGTEGGGGGGAGGEGDAEAARQLYDEQGCGNCHTFEPAGSTAEVGPNLDESETSFDEAVTQIANGGGGMPAFKDQLSEEEIRNLAAFVTGEGG